MNYMAIQTKMKRRSSRMVSTTFSVLSIIGSTSSTNINRDQSVLVQLRGNKWIESTPHRDLKQKKYEEELLHRPLVSDDAHHEHIRSQNPSLSGNPLNEEPITKLDHDVRIPYYPDLSTHTCRADNNYPEHYLYDVKTYFSHSPQLCCQMHFIGKDIDSCIEDFVDDSLGINSGSMMMKTEALGSGKIHPTETSQVVAGNPSSVEEIIDVSTGIKGFVEPLRTKKPILKHGTTWYSGSGGSDTESDKAEWSGSDAAWYSKQVRCDYTGWGSQGSRPNRDLQWNYGLVAKSSKGAKTKSAKSNTKAAKSDHSTSSVDDDSKYHPCIPTYAPSKKELMPITPIPTYAPITPIPTYAPITPIPTYAPITPIPSYKAITTIPTYETTTYIPTYAPTAVNETTYFPTMDSSTFFPTINSTTYSPTMKTTANLPTITTDFPTAGAIETSMPTFVPTAPSTSSSNPTMFPTFTPTNSQTMDGTISTPLDLLVWGSALSTSQPETDGNILVPLETEIDGIDASAGSKYSLIVNTHGDAYSTGFISDPNSGDYHGHLGVRPQDLTEGQNTWIQIDRVFDPDRGGVTFPPPFIKVFAGVENKVDKGDIHSILLDVNGNAWATGSNAMGQLCLDDTIDKMIPQRIRIKNIVDVAVGGQHTLLLDNDGTIYGCGSNEFGQLGLRESVSSTPVPLALEELQVPATTVSAGKEHSLIMTKDGNYVMGSNKYGQLCVDTNGENVFIPSALDVEAKLAKSFEAGQYSSYLLYIDGSVNSCGRNDFGQLGDGTNDDAILVTVAMPEESKAIRLLGLGPSASSAFFVSEFETVWAVGRNDYGQLGVGDEDDRNIPTLVTLQADVLVYVLSSAEDHSLMLKLGGVDVTQTPTAFPTIATIDTYSPTSIPTFSPTTVALPTFLPTSAAIPTSLPTIGNISTESPTQTGLDYFFWGAPEAVGKPADTPDVIVPLYVGSGAIFSGVGTKYTIVILADGSAMAAGYVDSIDDYQGHLGIDPDLVVQGVNEFRQITHVYDPKVAVRKLQSTLEPTTTPSYFTSIDPTIATAFPSSVPTTGSTLSVEVDLTTPSPTATPTYMASFDPTIGTAFTTVPTIGSTPSIGTILTTLSPTSESTPTVSSPYSISPTSSGLSALVDAPSFDKVFAGVENIPDTGAIHSILLDKFGNAWAMGNNEMGQLCLGNNVDRMIPEKIPVDGKVIDVAIGGEHTLLLLEDGSVFGCGSNVVGQLGIGQNEVQSPTKLDGLNSPVSSVSAGHSHSLFMASDGIYLTGSNSYGQLCTDTDGQNVLTITALNIDERVAVSFEAIKESTFILYEDGSVNSCGRNDFGQLGDGSNEDDFLVSVDIPDRVVRLLGAGPSAQSVLFVTTDELVWGTGLNDRGQLGVGDTVNKNIPTRVKFEDLVAVDQLCISEDHSFALGAIIGTLFPTEAPSTMVPALTFYFWGAPDSIGKDISTDVLMPLESGDQAIDTCGGSAYTVIILSDGTALSAGFIDSLDTYAGHLGRDETTIIQGVNEMLPISLVYDGSEIVDAPVFVRVFAGVENSPDSGVIHTILLDAQGQAWAMGSNGNGQLCLGESVDKSFIPEKIPLEGKIVDVAIGGEHTLLLDESGNVYGCGLNNLGQLGLGITSKTTVPTLIDGLTSITNISAGHSHSLFKSDNSAYFTGSNEFGQLCLETNGENLLTPEPLDILGIASSVGLEAIKSSSYILYSDGSVNGCGKNDFGQLGDGTNANQTLTLVEVNGVVRLLGVGPSSESIFFVTNDEYVWGTGLNDRGQLGVGDTENRNLPTQVKFEERVIVDVLSASGDHTVALGLSSGTYPPNKAPTLSPIVDETLFPTFSPTPGSSKQVSAIPTAAPTGLSSSSPTAVESSAVPTVAGSPVQGEMHFWGASGSLGKTPPDIILSPLSSGIVAANISAGSKYSILVLPNGTASSAGFIESVDDYHGHLGVRGDEVTTGENPLRPITSVYNAEEDLITDAPFFVAAFAGASQPSSPGLIHTLLIDEDGQAWATGSNNRGQLCLGDFDDRLIPERVPLSGEIESAAIGSAHSLFLLKDGSVYGCGSNEAGQLGLGAVSETDTPTLLEGISGVQSLSAGFDFSLFKASDVLYVTGSNMYGQLCVNETVGQNVTTPYLISDVDMTIVSSFDAIRSSSYISFTDGSVGACGRNNFGQLGDGNNIDRFRTELEPLPDGTPLVKVYGGPSSESVFFVSGTGATYATGLNDKGQLGVGDQVDRNLITLVEYGEGAPVPTRISASGDHTLSA